MPPFDICICYHPKDSMIFEYCIPSIRRYLPEANTIYVVSAEKPELDDIHWIPETEYPFSKEDILKFIPTKERVGWYYQQLLKLYFHRVVPNSLDNILILDADVILKKQIQFFEDSKILFAVSPENTPAYFEHMEKLVPGLEKQTEYSGIVHHMMTKREHLQELFLLIEQKHGEPVWKAMLHLVKPENYSKSGMSEYEIYFNYCLKNYPNHYKIRLLEFANCDNFQDFVQKDVSLVALHAWMRD